MLARNLCRQALWARQVSTAAAPPVPAAPAVASAPATAQVVQLGGKVLRGPPPVTIERASAHVDRSRRHWRAARRAARLGRLEVAAAAGSARAKHSLAAAHEAGDALHDPAGWFCPRTARRWWHGGGGGGGGSSPAAAAGDGPPARVEAIAVAAADGSQAADTMHEHATHDRADALRRAAAAGDPVAQFRLAAAHAAGDGAARDPAAAVRWYGQAARRGHPEAQSALRAAAEAGQPQAARYLDFIRTEARAAGGGGSGSGGGLFTASLGVSAPGWAAMSASGWAAGVRAARANQ